MSLASHAIIRLRRLWKAEYLQNRLLDAIRHAYPSSQHSRNAQALLEQLEPRTLLSTVIFDMPTDPLEVPEGSSVQVKVSLSEMPTGPEVYTIVPVAGGDSDITTGVSSMYFSETDWYYPKIIEFFAATDTDNINGTASFEIRDSNDYVIKTITVNEVETPLLVENFESTAVNTWPANWTADANAVSDTANNGVVLDPATNEGNVLKLFGQVGASWAALAYTPCDFGTEFSLSLRVYNGAEVLSGSHPDRALIGMRQGTSWTYPGRTLLGFLGSGNLQAADGSIIGTYSTGQWYDVQIDYKLVGNSLNVHYWLGTQDLGSVNVTVTDLNAESSFNQLDLEAQEGSAYFDDIVVNKKSSTTLGDVEWLNFERTKEYSDYSPETGMEGIDYDYDIDLGSSGVIEGLTITTPWGETIYFNDFLPVDWDAANPNFERSVNYEYNGEFVELDVCLRNNSSYNGWNYSIEWYWDTPGAMWDSLGTAAATVSFTDSTGAYTQQLEFANTTVPDQVPDIIGAGSSGNVGVAVPSASITWTTPVDSPWQSYISAYEMTETDDDISLTILGPSSETIYDGIGYYGQVSAGITSGTIIGLGTDKIIETELEYEDVYYPLLPAGAFTVTEKSTALTYELFTTESAAGSTGVDLAMIGQPVLNKSTYVQGETMRLIGDGVWGFANLGDVPAIGFGLECRLSTDTIWGNEDDIVLFTDVFDDLAAGEFDIQEVGWYHPVQLSNEIASGYYYFGMMLDSADRYAESKETNNVAFAAEMITIGTPAANPLSGLDLEFYLTSELKREAVNVVNEHEFWFTIRGTDVDLISSARFQAPSGTWYDLESSPEGNWEICSDLFESESELNAAFPQGYYYTVEITLTNDQTGTTEVFFGDANNQTALVRPSEYPDMVDIGLVAYDVSTNPTFQWAPISDTTVTDISAWLAVEPDGNSIDRFSTEGNTTTTWAPSVSLSTGETYVLSVAFQNESYYQNDDAFMVSSRIANIQQVMFQTDAQSAPDFVAHSVTVQSGDYVAGDTVGWGLHIANAGTGIAAAFDAYGESVLFTHKAFLSTDQIFDESDVLVWEGSDCPNAPGWEHDGGVEDFVIPAGITDGYYYLGFFMDDQNLVAESDETNNIAFSAETITVGTPANQIVYKVNSLSDVVAYDGVLTLREAIQAANTNTIVNEAQAGSDTHADVIIFDAEALQAQAGAGNPLTITLNGKELVITDELKISGLGASSLAIDADGLSRVFSIGSGVKVVLSGLTIAGGYSSSNGGGILNLGMLNIENSIVTANAAACKGGGIYNPSSILTLKNTDVSANVAGNDGGGINNLGGTLTVINSTVCANSAMFGGGIFQFNGTATIVNSTFSDNQASCYGGSIYHFGSTILFQNSISWGNYAFEGREIYSDGFSSTCVGCFYAYNSLINEAGIFNDDYGFTFDEGGNISTDPLFVDSANGDYSLQAGSAAIDAGDDALAVDMKGNALVVDSAFAPRFNGAVDIGAYEYYAENMVVESDINIDLNGGFAPGVLLDKNGDGTPDTLMDIYNGTEYQVVDLTATTNVSSASPDNPDVQITVNKTNGWIYTSFADPYGGSRDLLSVTASDGRVISPSNWWIDGGNVCVLDDPVTEYFFGYDLEEDTTVRCEFDSRGRLTYQDADGDNVTVVISGGGSGYVLLPDKTGDAIGIYLSDTTAKTSLSFSVKADKINGGTGYTTIGGIEVDGLIKSISGKTVNLSGKVNVNTDTDDVTAKDSVSIIFAGVQDSAINTNGLAIKSLSVVNWNDTDDVEDSIAASWIGKITVTGRSDNRKTLVDESISGDFSADLLLGGADSNGTALGSISIAGKADGMIIDADDKAVGTVTAKQWNSGQLTAGVVNTIRISGSVADWSLDASAVKTLTFGALFDSDINVNGTLGSVSVTGWKILSGEEIPVFTSGSKISADYIKSASFVNWDTNDMTQLLVPVNSAREDGTGNIGKLSYRDTRIDSKENWTWKLGQPKKWNESIEPIEYVV